MLSKEENEFLSLTGPGTPMGTLFRSFWIPALLSSELPAPDCPPVRVRLLGEDLVAFRDSEGKVGLLDAHCPHRRADLFFGRNEESGLRCVYHGWKFDVAGNCVDMPNEPAESNFKGKITTTAYPCQDRGGLIWTYMGQTSRTPDFPQIPWTLVPEDHRFAGKMLTECNYLQAMEGELDNSHVSFLHSPLSAPSENLQLTGGSGPSLAALQMRDKTPRGFVQETNYGILMGWRRNPDGKHHHWRLNQWLLPCTTLISSPPGGTQIAVTRPPRDDETSWAFIVHWNADHPLAAGELSDYREGRGFIPEMIPGTFTPKRNARNEFLLDRALQRSFNFSGITGSIHHHDLAVTTSMGTIVDRTKEHLGTADVVAIAVRRKLEKTARALQAGEQPYSAQHGEVFRVKATEGLLEQNVTFENAFEAIAAPAS